MMSTKTKFILILYLLFLYSCQGYSQKMPRVGWYPEDYLKLNESSISQMYFEIDQYSSELRFSEREIRRESGLDSLRHLKYLIARVTDFDIGKYKEPLLNIFWKNSLNSIDNLKADLNSNDSISEQLIHAHQLLFLGQNIAGILKFEPWAAQRIFDELYVPILEQQKHFRARELILNDLLKIVSKEKDPNLLLAISNVNSSLKKREIVLIEDINFWLICLREGQNNNSDLISLFLERSIPELSFGQADQWRKISLVYEQICHRNCFDLIIERIKNSNHWYQKYDLLYIANFLANRENVNFIDASKIKKIRSLTENLFNESRIEINTQRNISANYFDYLNYAQGKNN